MLRNLFTNKSLVILLVALGVIIYISKNYFTSITTTEITEVKNGERQINSVKFYEDGTFKKGVKESEDVSKPEYLIKGGIVPHHLFAGSIIADFFKRLSFQSPRTIILIGPNHYEKGAFKALGSLRDWETPYGVVETDQVLIKELTGKNLIKIDEVVLQEDHATSSLLPFVKYYMNDTKIIQILLKGTFSEKESEILATNLAGIVGEDVVILAAVDFSHYLNSIQAKNKDELSLRVMKDFDYKTLYGLNNDYLDSPPSIGVLLKVMQKLNSTNMEMLVNTNSGEMQKNNSIETTSYFSILYH